MTNRDRSALLQFGPNELDPVSFELRRSNRKVRLAPQPLELLVLLVERRGQLVRREEIGKTLWPGLDVSDLDARINTAIGQIRAALNDDPAKPRYITTVIGRGYRFTAAVEAVARTGMETVVENGVGLTAPETTSNYPLAETSLLQTASVPETPAVQLKYGTVVEAPQQFATLPIATLPTSAPMGASSKRTGWYALIAASCILAAGAIAAVLHVVSSLGTRTTNTRAMTFRQVTTNDSEIPVGAAAISPDGRLIAYIDTEGFFVKELATSRTETLRSPLLQGAKISWFPDGSRLLISGFPDSSSAGQIWIVSRSNKPPELFRDQSDNGVVSPDGASVAFTVNGGKGVWIAGVAGDRRGKALVEAAPDELISVLFWAADSRRLGYLLRGHFSPEEAQPGNAQMEANYRWWYVTRDIKTGHVTALRAGMRFQSAAECVGGVLYYLQGDSWFHRTDLGIWAVRIDPRTGRFVESPKLLVPFKAEAPDGISASIDGRVLAAVMEQGHANVYVGEFSFPGPELADVQRLTYDSKTDFPHAWNPTGEWVYFESNRDGGYHLYRQRRGTHVPERLTFGNTEQVLPELTGGGQTLVYEQFEGSDRSIYRARADGSAPAFVRKLGPLDEWGCSVHGAVCVLREIERNDHISFSELDLVKGKGKELARTAWMPNVFGDWSLSVDGSTVALPDHDEHSPAIRLVPLDGGPEIQIKVHESAKLWGLHWAADDKGFFAELRTGAAVKLEYVDLLGNTHLLRKARYNMWGVPSPDGKEIAFPDYTLDRNVFIWQ